MAAAATASDRLSNLPDDVLARILSFAPAREAASATALSRRWRRPLFLRTDAVNLDYRSYATARGGGRSPLLHHHRALQDTGHALASHYRAHGRFPSKVTVVTRDQSIDEDILLSACADGVVAVEELRLDSQDGPWPPLASCAYEDILLSACEDDVDLAEELVRDCQDDGPLPPPTACDFFLDMWSLPLHSLPFAALRVLDLKGCLLLEPSASSSLAFPCLHALRLRLCAMDIGTLQDLVRAAPNLADLRLESLRFWDPSPRNTPAARCLRLRCPAATVVVVTKMATDEADACSLQLDAPRLRRFRYTQTVPYGAFLSFKSPAPGLEQVHLDVHSAAALRAINLGGDVCHARSLKLTVCSIADIGVDHMPVFPDLEKLEIEELCGGLCPDNHRAAAAAAVVSLLRSCPAVHELRLKFCWRKYLSSQEDQVAAIFGSTACKSSMGSDEDADCCEALDVAGLFNCGCMLDCLRLSLRRVVVQFDMDALSCFQVRLVKFLAQNAIVLEEVGIDGGSRYGPSCMDRMVARWRRAADRQVPFARGRRKGLLLFAGSSVATSSAATCPPLRPVSRRTPSPRFPAATLSTSLLPSARRLPQPSLQDQVAAVISLSIDRRSLMPLGI